MDYVRLKKTVDLVRQKDFYWFFFAEDSEGKPLLILNKKSAGAKAEARNARKTAKKKQMAGGTVSKEDGKLVFINQRPFSEKKIQRGFKQLAQLAKAPKLRSALVRAAGDDEEEIDLGEETRDISLDALDKEYKKLHGRASRALEDSKMTLGDIRTSLKRVLDVDSVKPQIAILKSYRKEFLALKADLKEAESLKADKQTENAIEILKGMKSKIKAYNLKLSELDEEISNLNIGDVSDEVLNSSTSELDLAIKVFESKVASKGFGQNTELRALIEQAKSCSQSEAKYDQGFDLLAKANVLLKMLVEMEGDSGLANGPLLLKLVTRWKSGLAEFDNSISHFISLVLSNSDIYSDPRFSQIQAELNNLPNKLPKDNGDLEGLINKLHSYVGDSRRFSKQKKSVLKKLDSTLKVYTKNKTLLAITNNTHFGAIQALDIITKEITYMKQSIGKM